MMPNRSYQSNKDDDDADTDDDDDDKDGDDEKYDRIGVNIKE